MGTARSGVVRSAIEKLTGYVPGEQPRELGWVKLNTNENPYPPSPRVVEAIAAAANGRLNVYPDPLTKSFCQTVADLFDVSPDCVLPANGSDENLTILIRTFVDADEQVAFPYPSYVLYETLAGIQGANCKRLLLRDDWSWDHARNREAVEKSRLVFVPNPNSPSGNCWSEDDLQQLIPSQGILVLDEAYADFCDVPHCGELLQGEMGRRMVMTRTLSKSYSLAGIRFGFAIADAALIAEMRKVKDSYNCNTLSLAAATAALEDQQWMLQNAARIRETRQRLTASLTELGFDVVPSQANFVWATHSTTSHSEIDAQLKQRKILVRHLSFSGLDWDAHSANGSADGLRITVGTDAEIDQLLVALRAIL